MREHAAIRARIAGADHGDRRRCKQIRPAPYINSGGGSAISASSAG
jgi:hypothetical protein